MTFFNAFNDGLAEPIAPYQLLSARLNDWDQHNDNMTGHDLGDLSLNAAELTDADWGFIDFSGQADINALGTDSSKIPYFPSALPSLALLPIASPSTLQGPPGNLLANTDSSTPPLADLPTRNRRLNACAELEMFSRLSLNTPKSSPARSTINPTLVPVSSPDAAAYTMELFDIEPVTNMSFLSPSSLSTSDNSSGPSLFSSPSPSDMYSDVDATTPTNNYSSSSSPPPRRLTRPTGVERRAKAIRRIRQGVGLSIGRGTISIKTALRNNSESPSVSESESESDSDFESDLGEPVPSGNPKRPFGCGRELEAVGVPCKRTFTRKHDWNRHQVRYMCLICQLWTLLTNSPSLSSAMCIPKNAHTNATPAARITSDQTRATGTGILGATAS